MTAVDEENVELVQKIDELSKELDTRKEEVKDLTSKNVGRTSTVAIYWRNSLLQFFYSLFSNHLIYTHTDIILCTY